MDNAAWREAKDAIKHLFGRPLRVLLAAWLADFGDDPVYLQQVQAALLPFGEAPSGVSNELREFVRQEMLHEIHDGRRVYFVRRESPLWAAYGAIVAAYGLLGSDAGDTSAEEPART
ncbi:MAG: hypothetical protein QOD07_168 [Frankiaceae bacterium]|nr:hypothetical protein [Frankiaceae bacterium]